MRSKGAGFFNIDRRIWWALCATGKINLPVAYLTIANGTGRDNKTSKWSAKSCETHAGMHRSYASKAIQELLDQGFLALGEKHTKAFPRYLLTDWPTFAGINVAKQITSLSPIGKAIVKTSVAGKVDAKSPKAVVDRKGRDLLVSRGVLQMRAGGFVCTSPGREASSTAEDLIWLPNTFVQGAAAELSPLARLKATGDMWCLRMLVDLYHAHNLAADGGVNKLMIRQNYERFKAGSMESHVIWAFKPSGYTRSTEGFLSIYHTALPSQEVWDRVHLLENMGVLQFVPHLMPNSGEDAEPLHPYGLNSVGEPTEQELGASAHFAGKAMLWEREIEAAEGKGFHYFAPVWNTLPDAQLVGIARLTYRPQTRLTADWHSGLSKCESLILEYNTWRVNASESLSRSKRAG